MVQMNLSSLFESFPSQELTSQEKEDVYETIVQAPLEPDLPPDKLSRLFEISRDILKYKGDQVDSLLADLDILASTHGVDEIREELAKTGRQTEQLEEELQAKERELTEEKARTEKLISEIADLQKEKNDMRRELLLAQQEKRVKPASDSDAELVDIEQLRENVQHKNKHIMQLLTDIETLEKENDTLQSKLNLVRREMSEATTNLTKLAGENISLRQSNYESKEKITVLEERNAGLVSQVSELVEERRKKDAQLDEHIDALGARVVKWQEILSYKDSELAELRSQLNEVQSITTPLNYNVANYGILTQSLEKQEERIEELQCQLVQATEDLTRSTELLQEFKRRAEERDLGDDSMNNMSSLKEDLQNAHARITFLEDKLSDAEQDAQARAEEMTELIIQLREYEDGVYGLKEARDEIRDLKVQVKVRDNQILKLVEQTNKLHLKTSNETLEGEDCQTDEMEHDFDTNDAFELRKQLRQYQQTAINLSMQNYDLRAEIINLKKDLGKVKEDDGPKDATETKTEESNKGCEGCTELQEKLELIIDENEGLRKGLHEILDSVHNHDGTSNVAIESECLESLLAALDSRHISGWYHPAMRLQVDVNKLEGNNFALRNELRETRLRESYFQAELQMALLRIEELENLLGKYETIKPPVPIPRRNIKVKASEDNENEEEYVEEIVGVDEPDSISTGVSVCDEVSEKGNNNGSCKSESHKSEDKHLKENEEKQTDDEFVEEDIEEEGVGEEIEFEEKATQTDNNAETKEIGTNGESINFDLHKDTGLKNGNKAKSEETDSFLNKFTKIEQNEVELREKCDELRQELEKIRSATESTLSNLNENKDKMFAEVGEMMKKVDLQLANMMSNSATQANELAIAAFQAQENKLTRYESELLEARKFLSEKEASLAATDNQLKELKERLDKANEEKETYAEKQVEDIKAALENLQTVVTQKEEVIERYQKLLEESAEEREKLVEKCKIFEEQKTSAKPSPRREKISESKAVAMLMEKWLTKVRSLEEQISVLTQKLLDSDANYNEAVKEVDNWKDIATKAEEKFSIELEERLHEAIRENDEMKATLKQQKVDSDNLLREKIRGEQIKLRKKEEEYKAKLREFENEISRLRSRTVTRTRNTNSAKKECLLMDRIKALEEELEECKSREQSNLQLRRDKCAEEFSKWDEKKRLQAANEKLRNELKEKTNQTETFEGQISRLKQIISRMERERITLQRRLKTTQDMAAKNITLVQSQDIERNELLDEKVDNYGPATTPRSLPESVSSSNEEAKTKGRSKRDLEKAIVALKKVVARLRAENSQIHQKGYVEHLQKELQKVQESYVDAVDRTLLLEEKLQESEAKIKEFHSQTYIVDGGGDRSEVMNLREQLMQKCELLSRVKVLLQRAMAREKELVSEVSALRRLVPKDKLVHTHDVIT